MAVGAPACDAPLRACGVVGGLPAEVLLLADLLEAPVALLLGPLLDAVLEVRLYRHHVGRAVYQDGPQEPRVLHLHEEVDYLALAVPVVLPQVVGRHAQRLGDGLAMRVLGVAGPQLVAADGGLGKPRPLRQVELRHPQLLASSPDPRAAGSLLWLLSMESADDFRLRLGMDPEREASTLPMSRLFSKLGVLFPFQYAVISN